MADGMSQFDFQSNGKMSAEDIIRIDWEKNYKDKGLDYQRARAIFRAKIEDGAFIARLGNTLIVLFPEDNFYIVKFHTISADDFENLITNMLKFFIALHKTRGTSIAYTFVNDRLLYNKLRKAFGSYLNLEPNEESPDKGKYKLVFEIGAFTVDTERRGKL